MTAPIVFVGKSTESAELWLARFREELPDEVVLNHPDISDPASVDVAIVAGPPPGILARFPQLKRVASLWAGVDAMLGDPSFPKGVVLSRLVDPVMTRWMVETAVVHTLSFHRELPDYRLQQAEARWYQRPARRPEHRTVGVLGLGELGLSVVRALQGFHLDVQGWSRSPKRLADLVTHAGRDGLRALVQRSDILINLLPLTEGTRGILNAELFGWMQSGSALINLARGGHCVEADLLAALDAGRPRWAALDVTAVEPLPADHPFWHHPQVILTPHVAALSDEDSAARLVAEEIRRWRRGEPPLQPVDLSAGY
ncbi:MAG: glyoxylate/hydroxypyruvate reductase A [Alphaproteobacteria bacterium]|nr:MAG: glyoxylate/hydroxypyruvate reductase A [Alphaproteobacteria bacterium]